MMSAETTEIGSLDSGSGGELKAESLSYSYSSGSSDGLVLNDLTFTVPAGSVTCIVGPSGCGKSTFLGLAAGLMAPTGGSLFWNDLPVELGPSNHLGMAFQQPGLFPWMTVERNVTVGLEVRGHSKKDARKIAHDFLETVGLSNFMGAYPSQLSGGMAQRVGIARALALKPQLLLLDEPFASVDAFTRLKLQSELRKMLQLVRPTVVLVTHDVSEAISLGDSVVVMSNRPASIKATVSITAEDKHKSSPSYARKLAQILEDLGVTEDA